VITATHNNILMPIFCKELGRVNIMFLLPVKLCARVNYVLLDELVVTTNIVKKSNYVLLI
jgi:hypothetical protein